MNGGALKLSRTKARISYSFRYYQLASANFQTMVAVDANKLPLIGGQGNIVVLLLSKVPSDC